MKYGIAFKLGVLLAVVGVVAAGMSGFYAYQASRDILLKSARQELLTSTRVLARRITLSREEISRNLQVLATHPAALQALRAADAGPAADQAADQMATLFAQLMRANPSYFQLRLIAASDYGLERVRVDSAQSGLLRVSGDALQEKGHFEYVADTLKLDTGETYLSRVSINHELGPNAGQEQPTLQLAMPVRAEGADKALGLIVVNIDLKGMFALLQADLPTGYQVFLVNGEGDILIHPDASKTFGFDRGQRALIQDEMPQTAEVVSGKVNAAVFETAGKDADYPPRVAAFIGQPIKVRSNESRMVLGVAQPLADVLSRSQPLAQQLLQIVSLLCLLCLFLAVGLARAITRPINAVSAAAQRFAEGQPSGPLPLARKDEIGSLARSFARMQAQITEQLADLLHKQEALEHLAQHDMLTGLPNRRLLEERLDAAIANARRHGGGISVLFIDLDRFKQLNDRYGHDAGDAVLKIIAGRLQGMMREVDTVARLGGDEFVVLLDTQTGEEHVLGIADKLLNGLTAPISYQGQELSLGASIGIGRYPQDGQTRIEIMAKADKAMYEAKVVGQGGVRFYSGAQ
ncbi:MULTISPECIES: diguanylate cyclase domain-containing protein [Roseateles]|uniref:Diguanylate cyclase n=1 Tax=Roseateles albus TaxID=2987525 RepID=A0ABT5KI08_9BURK|nr:MULTISPECIES: diguanylate cyclase [Roseateles]MCV2358284.1 diguanylate cyclase [Paucibacter sp. TC2R-5]MDC8772590.1 diguanylate cyclase [Roseateles albus]